MLALVSTPDQPQPVQVQEVEEPKAGPHEVLIEVRAFSVNRGELHLLPQRPGWRPGQDVAGTVRTAAAGGAGPKEGVPVVAAVDQGGWAQVVAAPVARVAELPSEVGFAEAATLPVAGLTALRALRDAGPLLNRRVLVTGAHGGVGHFAVQLAAMSGAGVTAAVGSTDRAEDLHDLGAERVVTYDEDPGGPFDAVLEGVGGAVLEASLRFLAPGGVVIVYGNASGQPARLSLASFGGKPAICRSFFIYQTGVESFGRDLTFLAGLVAAERLRPEVGFTASWRDTAAGLQALKDRQVRGKVVLWVD
jgi:NADPH2:quinone reductase